VLTDRGRQPHAVRFSMLRFIAPEILAFPFGGHIAISDCPSVIEVSISLLLAAVENLAFATRITTVLSLETSFGCMSQRERKISLVSK